VCIRVLGLTPLFTEEQYCCIGSEGKGQVLTTWARVVAVIGSAFLLVFGVQLSAQAQTGAGTVTQTLTDIQDALDELADAVDDIDADGDGDNTQSQDQSQNQNVVFPVGSGGHGHGGGGGGKSLPKTGTDAAEVGGIGTASLLAGASLMEFARRRRRNWIAPVSASEALATTSVAPRGSSEGDLLLPFFADGPAQNMTPPAGGGDFISPGF